MRCAQMHWSILVLFIPKISEVLVNQRLASDYPVKIIQLNYFQLSQKTLALDITKVFFSSDESR